MSPLSMIIFGFTIIFVMTTLGSALVYCFKGDISNKVNTILLGFASGIMIAASIWSLLIPSLDSAKEIYGKWNFVPAFFGFILGGCFLVALDKIIPHFHSGTEEEEGPKNSLAKSTKLLLAVTIHNIPEGLAVGFAFGAAKVSGESAAYIAALGLAIGLGIQNFPEGAAVSLPLKKALKSKNKAFLYGMISGVVEPISAVLGFFLSSYIVSLQPWLLSFAAGAMIFVVAEDLIPDSKLNENPHLGAWGVLFGFAIMMVLDVAFG